MNFIRFVAFHLFAIPASAWGMTRWIIGWALNDANYNEDRHRFMNGFGLDSQQEMPDAWSRVRVSPWSLHDWKNVTTEWTRLDAQRASKYFAFHICLAWAVAIIGFLT